MESLHIGADHLGLLPLFLAMALLVFLAAVALRTQIERRVAKDEGDSQKGEEQHGPPPRRPPA
jgi:hypothetical protein